MAYSIIKSNSSVIFLECMGSNTHTYSVHIHVYVSNRKAILHCDYFESERHTSIVHMSDFQNVMAQVSKVVIR